MEKALSGKDILKQIDGKANLLAYPDLANYDNIDQVLGKHKACVLLYLTSPEFGHWCCIIKHTDPYLMQRAGVKSPFIEFFDSYASPLDHQLGFVNKQKRNELNEDMAYLSKLLYESPYPVIYNDIPLQSKSKDVNTCGRWVVARLQNRDVFPDDFAKMIKKAGKSPDKTITKLTGGKRFVEAIRGKGKLGKPGKPNLKKSSLRRGTDKKGAFYLGANKKKFYYQTGDVESRNHAKKLAGGSLATLFNKFIPAHQAPITSGILRILDKFLPPVSDRAPPDVRKAIESNQNAHIVSISACRDPLSKGINIFTNLITLGKFEKAKKDLAYDQVFHLYIVVKLSNGRVIRFDKNQRVEVTNGPAQPKDCREALPPPKGLTLNNLFQNGEKYSGSASNYWVYSAHRNNCQRWVHDTLAGSGMLNDSLSKWILQDAGKLIQSEAVAEGYKDITDFAARVQGALFGRGK